MNRKTLLMLAVVMLLSLLPAASRNIQTTEAFAYETHHSISCSSFSAWGTSNAPYVTVNIYDPYTDSSLFINTFPTSNGTFAVNVTFPQQPTGNYIYYTVWGNTSATNPWSPDGEAYISIEEPCPATAALFVSSNAWSLGCSAFTASGLTNAPYVGVQVSTSSGNLYVGKFPASALGTFSFNATFATQPKNKSIQYRIWASNSPTVTNYDGSPYSFNMTARCK